MNKGAWPIAAVLGFGIAMFLPMDARAGEKVDDINVNIEPLPSRDNAYGSSYGVCHGYVEFRVRLKNSSTSDRVIHLSYPAVRDRWISDGVVVTRTVHVAGGQEAAVSLFQPPVGVDNETLEVRVEGVRDSSMIPLPSLREHRFDNSYPAAVLISRGVPQEFRDRVHPAVSGTPKSGSPGSSEKVAVALMRSELPVTQWSTNWLGYSCYDAILLTAKEVEEMPAQVQLAVRRYLECGGILLIHGRDVPIWLSKGGVALDDGDYIVGLGYAAASHDDGKAGWDAFHRRLIGSPLHAYHPEEKPGNLYNLLIAEATVPVRGLFVLVMLFGVGIGPANVWLLSRYKRRIWLWWNVPAISLLTCLIVFAYSLASEGITGRGKTASLTLLDERFHRAITIGYASYYCPLTPSVGPRFSVDTDVTLLENKLEPWRRFSTRGLSAGLRLVDWTNDQHLASGWVSARVPAYFQMRKNEDRRERLSVEKKTDGSLKIVNALGADIKRLYWADASGRIFEGHTIPAGAERTLSVMGTPGKEQLICSSSNGSQTFLRNIFCNEWLEGFNNLISGTQSPSEMLSPSCYIAFLDKSPFVEPGLAGLESEHSVAIVYGISKGQDNGR